MTYRPRHSRKEVRQVADWLVAELAATYLDEDTDGHTIWQFPNGATIKLPETPRGNSWISRTRAAALKAAGHHTNGKFNANRARTQAALARAAEQRHRERLAAEQARRERERERERANRTRLIREEANTRYWSMLMDSGHVSSGGYRRSAVG